MVQCHDVIVVLPILLSVYHGSKPLLYPVDFETFNLIGVTFIQTVVDDFDLYKSLR